MIEDHERRTAVGRPSRPAPPTDAGRDTREEDGKGKSRFALLTEFPGLLLVSLVLALLIKTFLFQAFYIPSESMLPTFEVGDRVLVNKVVYHLHPPRRGDVIVFADPNPGPEEDRGPLSAFWRWLTEGLGIASHPEKDFIKRVIALPGETIEIANGRVFIDGRELGDEPYLADLAGTEDYSPFRVPPDSLFVMGDNRGSSSDSRGSLGPIPLDNVIGRAFVIIWPPSRMGWLRRADYTIAGAGAVPA